MTDSDRSSRNKDHMEVHRKEPSSPPEMLKTIQKRIKSRDRTPTEPNSHRHCNNGVWDWVLAIFGVYMLALW